jgi:hypothetical protein
MCVVSCMFLSANTQQISDKCQANIALPDKVPLVVTCATQTSIETIQCLLGIVGGAVDSFANVFGEVNKLHAEPVTPRTFRHR